MATVKCDCWTEVCECAASRQSIDDATPRQWDAAAKAVKLKDQTNGGSASYYQFPIPDFILRYINETGMIEARHVIRIMLNNDFDKGNIFKALVRLGEKAGVEPDYDINKSHFFLDCIKEAIDN